MSFFFLNREVTSLLDFFLVFQVSRLFQVSLDFFLFEFSLLGGSEHTGHTVNDHSNCCESVCFCGTNL